MASTIWRIINIQNAIHLAAGVLSLDWIIISPALNEVPMSISTIIVESIKNRNK